MADQSVGYCDGVIGVGWRWLTVLSHNTRCESGERRRRRRLTVLSHSTDRVIGTG
jgi:hypothetical protein